MSRTCSHTSSVATWTSCISPAAIKPRTYQNRFCAWGSVKPYVAPNMALSPAIAPASVRATEIAAAGLPVQQDRDVPGFTPLNVHTGEHGRDWRIE